MVATVTNLILEPGATFQRNIALSDENGQPLHVAGFVANGAIKTDHYANSFLAIFASDLTDGNLSLRLEANVTATFPVGMEPCVYDVYMSNGTDVYRIAEGLVLVDPGTGVNTQ